MNCAASAITPLAARCPFERTTEASRDAGAGEFDALLACRLENRQVRGHLRFRKRIGVLLFIVSVEATTSRI